MARKGENIYKRKDKRWEGRYRIGYKRDGTIAYGYVYAHSYSEVRNKLLPLKAFYANKSIDKVKEFGTFSEWSQFCMRNLIYDKVKPSTYAGYNYKLTKYILPELGDLKLQLIKEENIKQYIQSLQARGLSAGSINTIFRVLNQIISKAYQQGFMQNNPCSLIELPRRTKQIKKVLTIKEQQSLVQEALKEPTCSPIILSLYTGMRIGEISALMWENINLDEGEIYICQTLQRIYQSNKEGKKTRIYIGRPKTESSVRIIPISPHLRKYLSEKKQFSDSPYVINVKGSFAEPRVITDRSLSVSRQAGLEDFHFHCLRHTFATRALEQGADITNLSYIMGHASSKMTLDTYTTSLEEQRRHTMNLVDNLFQY